MIHSNSNDVPSNLYRFLELKLRYNKDLAFCYYGQGYKKVDEIYDIFLRVVKCPNSLGFPSQKMREIIGEYL